MMKKSLILILALAMTLSMILTGCGEKQDDTDKPDTGTETPDTGTDTPDTGTDTGDNEDVLKVALLINGTLGDKSFFDSADNGMKLAEQKFGDKVETKTIEMNYDPSKWLPTLQDVSDADWDIIIVGTWQMVEHLSEVALEYPDKKYVIFDSAVDYTADDYSNVYSINFKQNEGAFIAGVLASRVTTSGMERTNEDKKIGFLGGMDIPVINDFLVGYIEGAQYADPDMKVAISYIGGFEDSAKAKELCLAQYNSGVDIGFNVAGQAGLGQLDAAKEVDKYAIGVDSDQVALFPDDQEKAKLILTSVLKRVDQALLRSIEMHMEGTTPYGKEEILGFKEKAIGFVEGNPLVPADLLTELKDIEAKIINGDIKVTTAMGLDTDALNEIRNKVKP
ncbi:BMP family ABC transporter substrate-binding protein [Vallitalea pronyensis]|nr:BMP family ABC transporter substrate-binding protein [Vallitalea pronyensis]